MNPVYIYDTVRTPRGRAHPEKGALREIPSIDLLKIVFTALEHRNKLDTSLVDEIALGCSSATGEQGANIAKIASLYAGWHPRANGVTISSFCTSGLEAVEFAALKIMAGVASCAVAGGVESLTRVPIFSDRGPWFSDPNVARQTGFIPMGLAADLIANLEGFTHQDLDRYALESHRRAIMAWQGPDYKKDVIPVRRNSRAVLVHDDGMRADTSMEKLRSLPRLFDPLQYGDAIAMILNHEDGLERFECLHSAGNAPLMADAASLMLLGNRRLGTRLGIKPVARFINFASVSVDPVRMLHGVVDATKLVLKKSKLKLSDVDLFEVNESFAAIPLMYQKRLGVRADQLNISGGAIALGHPLGATGGILIGTLIHNLRRQDKKRGIATICGGAGIAQATLLEVL